MQSHFDMGALCSRCWRTTRNTRARAPRRTHTSTYVHTIGDTCDAISQLSEREDDVVGHLRRWRLLHRPGDACPTCTSGVLIHVRNDAAPEGSGLYCSTCNTRYSIRHGSVFAHTRLSLLQACKVIHLWNIRMPMHMAARAMGLSVKVITSMYHCIRERVKSYMLAHPVVFAADEIVEIDECYLRPMQTDKSRGAYRKSQRQWVIGMIGRNSGHVALEAAADHRTDTIRPLIDRHLPHRETATISDKDRSFFYLARVRDHYFSEKRKVGASLYVDTREVLLSRTRSRGNMQLHSNYIEGYWSHFRKLIGTAHSSSIDMLLYECEFRSLDIPIESALRL